MKNSLLQNSKHIIFQSLHLSYTRSKVKVSKIKSEMSVFNIPIAKMSSNLH